MFNVKFIFVIALTVLVTIDNVASDEVKDGSLKVKYQRLFEQDFDKSAEYNGTSDLIRDVIIKKSTLT